MQKSGGSAFSVRFYAVVDTYDAMCFICQLEKCEHEYRGSASLWGGNLIQWGIPAHVSWRHPVTLQSEPLHDDHLISAALVSVVADSDLQPRAASSTPAPVRPRARQSVINLDD